MGYQADQSVHYPANPTKPPDNIEWAVRLICEYIESILGKCPGNPTEPTDNME